MTRMAIALCFFRPAPRRGLVQVVDMSSVGDLTGEELTLSAIFSDRAVNQGGIMRLIGFDSFTGLTVDLGGDWSFTGGTYTQLINHSIPNADIQATSDLRSVTVTAANDFAYLAVLVGGDASATSSNGNWVAVDNVLLSTTAVPEPASALMAMLGAVVLTVLRRR